ncbi:MAG: hypothetical protein Q9186_000387 [Xanthomendoza sp. 1 TL-2023]
MRPSIFDLGETQHVCTRSNLKLVTRTRLHASLPDHLALGKSAQDLVMAGLWIVRGNRMKLHVRADLAALSRESNLDCEKLEDVLSDTLAEAKLSLKASLINPHPPGCRITQEFSVAFALNHLDSLQPNLPSMRAGGRMGIAANFYDTKPPNGIGSGFIDSIVIALHFSPILHLDLSPDSRITPASQYYTQGTGSGLAQLQPIKTPSKLATISWPDQTLVGEEGTDECMLFLSPRIEISSYDIEMLDDGTESLEMPLLPEMAFQPSFGSHVTLSTSQDPQTQEPSCLSGHTPHPLDLVRLLDASLRHTLRGTPRLSRRPRRPQEGTPDVQLVQETSAPSLADISPALFRPGYMKAISQRAPLISRIASSISKICPSAQPHDLLSSEIRASTSTLPICMNLSELQVRLWHLLQKRRWPTTAIEPLDCDDVEMFNRHERDRELLFDVDHKCNELHWTTQGWENDDEEMLDTDLSFLGELDHSDEDLFSSYEGTPFSSQDTASDCLGFFTEHGDDLLLEEE